MAQATVPPQDASSGLVRIEGAEAYLGKIRIEKGSSSLVADDTILSMVGASLKEGELYDSDSLNRGLLLADDLSGVSLTGFLQEGSEPGLVDLNLKTLKEARATAEFSMDNANARALGTERIVFSGKLVSPLKMAEVFPSNHSLARVVFTGVFRLQSLFGPVVSSSGYITANCLTTPLQMNSRHSIFREKWTRKGLNCLTLSTERARQIYIGQ